MAGQLHIISKLSEDGERYMLIIAYPPLEWMITMPSICLPDLIELLDAADGAFDRLATGSPSIALESVETLRWSEDGIADDPPSTALEVKVDASQRTMGSLAFSTWVDDFQSVGSVQLGRNGFRGVRNQIMNDPAVKRILDAARADADDAN